MPSDKCPRVAIVSHRFQRNHGQGRVNYEVVRAALARGFHVSIIATACSDDLASHPNARFVKVGSDRLPTELLRNVVFAFGSARWLRKHRPELDLTQANGFVTWEPCDIASAHFVHAAWGTSPWYPFRSFRAYSIYQRLYTALNTRWERQAFLHARRVIAVAKPVLEELAAIGVPRCRIDVVWNGVDTEQFQPGAAERSRFGLPEGVPLCLFVGDIRTPRKNLDTVLASLAQTPDIHLAVAGDIERSPYPAMARALGVADRVYFLGKVAAMPELMRSTDLFVFPSRYEAHPLVLLEAMASGLPSVVSGTFGAGEFLGEGGVILKDPNDARELAGTMNALLADPHSRKLMGMAAREQALRLQWTEMAAQYLQIFEEVMRSKKHTPGGVAALVLTTATRGGSAS